MTALTSSRFLLPAALLLVALAASFALAGFTSPQNYSDAQGELPRAPLTLVTEKGRFDFSVEVADEEEERQRGLMHRPAPGDGEGMLFLWPGEAPRERAFWMRATPASLDILYLGQDGSILSIAAETEPNSDAFIPSRGPAHGVLELRAGRAAEMGAKAGDKVLHPYFAE